MVWPAADEASRRGRHGPGERRASPAAGVVRPSAQPATCEGISTAAGVASGTDRGTLLSVRRFVGDAGCEGEAVRRALDQLYGELRLLINFFLPSMKLVVKTRHGSRVTKRYDRPQTPYARVLASPTVNDHLKDQLRTLYATLNPAALSRSKRRVASPNNFARAIRCLTKEST